MKLLFLTDNFYPELNAPATRTYEHCKEWIKQGIEVTVITGAPNFPEGKVFKGYKNKLYQTEDVDGIKVVRVWTYISKNEGFIKRIIDFVSFMFTSFIAGLFIKTDIIVATSPQFFTAISGRWLSFWKRTPWVMEVRDLWPESIKAVGAMDTNLAIKFFEYLERKMYKNASKIVVVTDTFKEQLMEVHKISGSKIAVVKNGANLSLFKPKEKNKSLIKELKLENKFIVGYIGTHGMAHALDFILHCAKKLKNSNIHFLFIGAGSNKEALIKLKEELQLKNVTMLGLVSKEEVREYISITDVSLVNLKKSDTFKSVIPSKIFESVAMHRPILLGVEGESKRLVEDYNIGETFEPENEEAFIYEINKMSENSKSYLKGYKRLKNDFDRKKLASKMLEFLLKP
jgi:glycosyltransferase involved in cell wall biosynthesis